MKRKLFLLFCLLLGVWCTPEVSAQKRLQYLATQTEDSVATVYLVYLDYTPTEWDGKVVVDHKDYRAAAVRMGGLTRIKQPSHITIDASTKDYTGTTTKYLFYEFTECLDFRGMEHLNTSEVTDMSYMFARCESLKLADISIFQTSKVKTMRGMFESCNRLATLTIGALDFSSMSTKNSSFIMTNFLSDCNNLLCVDFSQLTNCNDFGVLINLIESSDRFPPLCLIYFPKNLENIYTLPENLFFTKDGVNFEGGLYILTDNPYYSNTIFGKKWTFYRNHWLPYPSTVERVTYDRRLNGEANALSTWFLPVEMPIPEGIEVYEFDPIATSGQVAAFKRSTDATLQPLKPYLLRGTGVEKEYVFNEVGHTAPLQTKAYRPFNDVATEASASGWRFVGTTTWRSAAQATADKMYGLIDGQWKTYEGSTYSTVLGIGTRPLRAFMQYVGDGSAPSLNTHLGDVTTDLERIELQEDTPTNNRVYDLNGRYLGTRQELLPVGMYIIGGKTTRID